jgi:hypothetical protein
LADTNEHEVMLNNNANTKNTNNKFLIADIYLISFFIEELFFNLLMSEEKNHFTKNTCDDNFFQGKTRSERFKSENSKRSPEFR